MNKMNYYPKSTIKGKLEYPDYLKTGTHFPCHMASRKKKLNLRLEQIKPHVVINPEVFYYKET